MPFVLLDLRKVIMRSTGTCATQMLNKIALSCKCGNQVLFEGKDD